MLKDKQEKKDMDQLQVSSKYELASSAPGLALFVCSPHADKANPEGDDDSPKQRWCAFS